MALARREDCTALAGRDGLMVEMETGSVGNIHSVVMFTVLVAELGTVPNEKVDSGVLDVVMVGLGVPSTGLKVVVDPGGPAQRYFPTMEGRLRHSYPMEGFQLRNMVISTPFPAAVIRESQVSP